MVISMGQPITEQAQGACSGSVRAAFLRIFTDFSAAANHSPHWCRGVMAIFMERRLARTGALSSESVRAVASVIFTFLAVTAPMGLIQTRRWYRAAMEISMEQRQ